MADPLPAGNGNLGVRCGVDPPEKLGWFHRQDAKVAKVDWISGSLLFSWRSWCLDGVRARVGIRDKKKGSGFSGKGMFERFRGLEGGRGVERDAGIALVG